LANRPEMVTSDWSDFLAVDWVDTSQSVVFLCQSKRPLCILSRLVTGSIEAALSFLSFFFLNFIFFSFFFIHFFSSTKYNKDYIHCNTWHCLHSGASTDMVMSSWGLERYQTAGYKKKQPIESIDTKSSFYKKAETREQKHTLPSTCHVNQKQKTRPKHWTFRSPWPKRIWYRKP
jgi:hypothetical protein